MDSDLNTVLGRLHDNFKALILTCNPNFPQTAPADLEFLAQIADAQGAIAAYQRALLHHLFRVLDNSETASEIRTHASEFLQQWENRGDLAADESRSVVELEAAIREDLDLLLERTRLLGEAEFSAEFSSLAKDHQIPELLYQLTTLQGQLSWYADRCIARMMGELAELDEAFGAS